jgi:glucan phosphoethanolaminetransferase (alkaline phosphatase superfamily)
MHVSKKWLIYSLAWTPFLLTLFLLLRATGVHTTATAARCAVVLVLVAASAGAVVGWRAELGVERTRRSTLFIGHIAGALAYALVYCGTIFVLLLWDRTYQEALEIARGFIAWQFAFGLFVYGVIAVIFHALETTRRLREARQRVADADRLRIQAELEALRGRLQPHF